MYPQYDPYVPFYIAQDPMYVDQNIMPLPYTLPMTTNPQDIQQMEEVSNQREESKKDEGVSIAIQKEKEEYPRLHYGRVKYVQKKKEAKEDEKVQTETKKDDVPDIDTNVEQKMTEKIKGLIDISSQENKKEPITQKEKQPESNKTIFVC